MPGLWYIFYRELCRCISTICIRERVLFADRSSRITGRVLLVVTHLSHLEPAFVSLAVSQPIRWMTRAEFFELRWASALLSRIGAFKIDRFGSPIRGVREAIRLLHTGQTVGMFPEGGVATGEMSVLRGGPIQHGCATIAIRTDTPILPVAVIGTEKLNCLRPWIPFKRGSVCIAFGRPVRPPARPPRTTARAVRAELADCVRAAFVSLYAELLGGGHIREGDVP